MTKYKQLRGRHTQEAAAKSGISVSSARRIESNPVLPSQRALRHWRTRADPLSEIWDAEVVPMLEGAPGLMAVTVLEELQRRYPMRIGESVLRTLQRRQIQREARQLASAAITRACARHRTLGFASYDRLSPSQDTLPRGGFGNLIEVTQVGRGPGFQVLSD